MNDPSHAFELFSSTMLPSDFSQKRSLEMATLSQARRLAKGEILQTGRDDDSLVFVGQGAIKLVAHASGDRDQVMSFLFAGDLAIVPAVSKHSNLLCALTASDLLIFPAREFLQFSCSHADLGQNIIGQLLGVIDRGWEKIIALGRKTARERMASFFLAMAERVGVRNGPSCEMDLPMSRRDIADSLGLTNETVSRQLAEFREKGLIETAGRSSFRLPDLKRLKQCTGAISEAA